MKENNWKDFEATPRQIIMGGVTGLIWVDLKNPVTDSHSCHSWKCDGIFYSKTMQHYRSVVAFLPWVSFWNFSLNFHFPLLLHHFYSLSYRIQAEISSFYSWMKFFHEWTYFAVLFSEAVNSRNVLLIAFWRHSLCSTITSLVPQRSFATLFFIVLLNFSFFIYWNVIYLQFWREYQISLN